MTIYKEPCTKCGQMNYVAGSDHPLGDDIDAFECFSCGEIIFFAEQETMYFYGCETREELIEQANI